jgi:phosphoglycerol transferase
VLNPDERAKLAVAGPELGSLFRVLFYVDSPTAGMVVLPQGAPFNRSLVSADRKWVLLIGDHAVPANAENMIAENGFTLFQLPTIATNGPPGAVQKLIDFSQPFQFGVINRISGVSGLEPFGRWSDGNEVKIEMASALPRSFDLDLSANAFGPNVSLPFSIRIGTETRTFHLSSLPGDVAFTFVTDGNVKVITIQVPQPTSPKELGLSDDDRLLGIALRQMTLRFQVQ